MLTTQIKSEDEQTWLILPGNSVFIDKFINKNIADYLFDALEKELIYIKRGELKFHAPNGQDIPLPRLKQFYGTIRSNGDYPIYRYGLDKYPETKTWTPVLKVIRDMLEKECGQNSNHCIPNKYEKSTDHIWSTL